MLTREARPGWQARGRAAERDGGAIVHRHCTPAAWDGQPIALAVRKPGRGADPDGWCVVAKLTCFLHSDEPILAVAWQSQHGTSRAISLPEAVLAYAEAAGATDFFLQDRRRRLMWTTPLATFHRGKLQPDGERYVPLDWLELMPYREWHFAELVLRLAPPPCPRRGPAEPTPPGRQLAFWSEGQR